MTPLVQLDHRHWLLELFHGPTLAFKDVALQLLGQLFEKFLSGGDTDMTIVGATSGDTGSAAIEAVAGREHIQIFMLHPEGRVSDVQRRQMTTVLAPNVHNIAIDGSFDDAQAMVKRMFGDEEARGQLTLSAVNSINWARLMAQVVYYFYAAVRLGGPDRPIAFSVPTGNFGDVFAGYVAAQMGLPIARLVVATNVNDILHRALTTGDYSAGTVTATATPSMDIQVSSNFERLLFDLSGRDGAAITSMMGEFDAQSRDDDPRRHAGRRARAVFERQHRRRRDGARAALGAGTWRADHRPAHARSALLRRARWRSTPIFRSSRWRRRIRQNSAKRSSARPGCVRRCLRGWATCSSAKNGLRQLPGDYDAVKAFVLAEAARG